jgi:hypothetical protein
VAEVVADPMRAGMPDLIVNRGQAGQMTNLRAECGRAPATAVACVGRSVCIGADSSSRLLGRDVSRKRTIRSCPGYS